MAAATVQRESSVQKLREQQLLGKTKVTKPVRQEQSDKLYQKVSVQPRGRCLKPEILKEATIHNQDIVDALTSRWTPIDQDALESALRKSFKPEPPKKGDQNVRFSEAIPSSTD